MFVYFIECMAEMEPIKIGVSHNPGRRLKDLQGSNPFSLRLLETVRFQNETQAYAMEKMLHEIFDMRRMTGEWFSGDVYQDALRLCRICAVKGVQHLEHDYMDSIRARIGQNSLAVTQ